MKTNLRKSKSNLSGITRGSGNVFADLGFSQRDSAELQVKAEMTRQIYKRIRSLSLTQVQAAARLGISQPDVSKLMNARFTGYSTDRLIALLNALEIDVEIVLHPKKSTPGHLHGTVQVRASAA